MILAGVQPSYLPWLGYFEQIHRADLFIFFDELQYEKYSWRNRNKIKIKDRWAWLIVPVVSQNLYGKAIHEVEIDPHSNWQAKHWRSLVHHYGGAPYFKEYQERLEPFYRKPWTRLSELNIALTRELCAILGIDTPTVVSSEIELERKFSAAHPEGDATDRIVFACEELKANAFYEGLAGKNYIDEKKFADRSIRLEYQDYDHPVYKQRGDPFISHLSVVDLLFNCGPASRRWQIT